MSVAKRLVLLTGAFRSLHDRFVSDRRGAVAIIFALTLPLLLMITLGGIDMHRATTLRGILQDSLDAATLAAARSQFVTDAEITEVGLASLKANLAAYYPDINIDDDATMTFHLAENGAVVADIEVRVKTMVAAIVLPPYGRFLDDYLPVSSHSEVMRSNNRIEVALVLDNTGSMAQEGRLVATKAAAIDLINRLEAADSRSIEPDAIKISLVPFSQTVRVLPGYTANNGVTAATGTGWLSNANGHTGGTGTTGIFATGVGRFTMFQRLGTGWSGCIESRPQPYDIRDTPSSTSDQATMFVPYFAPDEPDANDYRNDNTWQSWLTTNHSDFNNYVDDKITGSSNSFGSNSARNTAYMERVRNNAKYVSTSGLNTSKGPNLGCTLQPVIRLTSDYDALRTAVDDMVAVGNTNVPLGAMWGWHTLSPTGPFSDGRAYGEERLEKIIIIMTDGANVLTDTATPNDSWYNGLGYIWQGRLGITSGSDSTRRARMDNRMDHPTAGQEDLCGNMKARNIRVYTVAVQVDSQAQTVLQRCATAPAADHYFRVDSAGGIGTAFDRIAGAIENLRISG